MLEPPVEDERWHRPIRENSSSCSVFEYPAASLSPSCERGESAMGSQQFPVNGTVLAAIQQGVDAIQGPLLADDHPFLEQPFIPVDPAAVG